MPNDISIPLTPNTLPPILHIDTGKTWRGGQQQAFYLHQYLCKHNYQSLMVCKKGSAMAVKCAEQGLPFQTLPLISEFDIYSAFKIVKLAKQMFYHRTHSDHQTTPTVKAGGGRGGDTQNRPILHLHTAHALTIGLIAKTLYKKLILIAVRRVDFTIKSLRKYNHKLLDILVCISKNILNVAQKDGIAPEKLRLVYSGIDTERYQTDNGFRYSVFGIREKESLVANTTNEDIQQCHWDNLENRTPKTENRSLRIGTIAAYVGHKDYPTLLRAARIVLDTVKANNLTPVQFIAIGDGKQWQEIASLHKDLNLGDDFIMAGFQEDIKSYLHSFDIFVLSSKLEGLGTSVLDAMSARKPIVACASGGIPEMIKHRENGLLAEKENPSDLAEKLLELINNPDLREKLAKQAEIDVQEFSIENTILKNIELYNELGGGA